MKSSHMEEIWEDRIVVPGNMPDVQAYSDKMKKLINTVNELGGTVYDVAVESGFLAAVRYMELHYEELTSVDAFPVGDAIIVTEVYVQSEDKKEPERIFVCSKDARGDVELIKEGEIWDGKLIIGERRMQELCRQGYTMLPVYPLWHNDLTYVGNGFNQALWVTTAFESVFVMPDIHSLEESIRVVAAEDLIKEKYEPGFFIEKIVYPDDIDTGYRRLSYQISYIRNLYPDVYELVWSPMEEKHEPVDFFDLPDAVLGISLGEKVSYAACRMQDGSVKMVPNMEKLSETPEHLKYKYGGCGDILNAGVAFSKMGLIIKEMYLAAGMQLEVNVTKAFITFSGELPDWETIEQAMEKRENTALDLLAFEEIAEEHPDGRKLIQIAADLAGIPHFEVVDSAVAVAKAYEAYSGTNALDLGEIALVYDMNQDFFRASLVKKSDITTLEVIAERTRQHPEGKSLPDKKESFSGKLEKDMKDFMMDSGLRAIGITEEREKDRKAYEKMLSSMPKVRNQLKRNASAKLYFDNGYLTMLEDYPSERFENCYRTVFRKANYCVVELFEKAELLSKDVSKVFLAGESSAYPFLREWVGDSVSKKASVMNQSEYAAAKGCACFEGVL